MPTPIGHTLAGSALALSATQAKSRWLLIFIVFFSILPDLDVIPGLFVGDVNRYHRLFSHSFLFIVGTGLAGAWLAYKLIRVKFTTGSMLFVGAGLLHLLMDILTLDTRAPFGCPLWWPFSDKSFILPVTLFLDFHRASDVSVFLQSIFNWHNAMTVGIEFLITVPFLIYAWHKRRKASHDEG